MDNYKKDSAIDNFISALQHDFYNIEKMSKFIIIEDEKEKKLVDESLKLINEKINDIIHSKSIDDVKRHVKLKKVFKKFGDKYES